MNKKEIIDKISDNIRLERLKKRYSQEKLAEMANITQKYLNLIENKKANPSIVIIVNICQALGVKISELVDF